MADVQFFFDPICPWAWITSRLTVEVADQRGLDVEWRFISLRMVNEERDYDRDFPPGYINAHGGGRRMLRIAAAVVTDPAGRSLLVRKRGSEIFMQPGGKIESGECALTALTRELREELGLVVDPAETEYIGSYRAVAANEENTVVRAEVFFLTTSELPVAGAEIDELLWVERLDDLAVEVAPLSRDSLLPLWAARSSTLF